MREALKGADIVHIMVPLFLSRPASKYIKSLMLLLGKVSMDVWLIHGFFYFYMFDYFRISSDYWIVPFVEFVTVNVCMALVIRKVKLKIVSNK